MAEIYPHVCYIRAIRHHNQIKHYYFTHARTYICICMYKSYVVFKRGFYSTQARDQAFITHLDKQ